VLRQTAFRQEDVVPKRRDHALGASVWTRAHGCCETGSRRKPSRPMTPSRVRAGFEAL
jgi:hypothetical protein